MLSTNFTKDCTCAVTKEKGGRRTKWRAGAPPTRQGGRDGVKPHSFMGSSVIMRKDGKGAKGLTVDSDREP